jgi:NAD+-dependent protein deacetylase SIR2
MLIVRAVPDFRSSQGLFKSLKEEHNLKGSGKDLFDASVYKDNSSTSSFHSMVSSMSRLTKDAKPTEFHHMLATIAKEDRLLRLYSQNVDGIDTSLEPLTTRVPLTKGGDGKWPRTVQLHGGLDKMVCIKCHELSDFDADLFSGPDAPPCPRCEEINDIRTNHEGKRSHGIGRLRPRMVLYNEHNPDDVAIGKVTQEDLRKRPDAVIVAGTTLKVPGVRRIVREMCGVVRDRRGGVAIWINNDPPPVAKDLEDCFDIIVQGPCDEVARHAAMRRWWDPSDADTCSDVEVSDDDLRKGDEKVQVVVETSKCRLTHANLMALPSDRHFNNSFIVTEIPGTPQKPLSSPEDWSPMLSRRSIMPSIETESDNITVSETGLLTPTKSAKGSPAKKVSPIKQLMLKNSASQAKKPGRPTIAAKTKKSNVKYVKPPLSKMQTKPNAGVEIKSSSLAPKKKPGPKKGWKQQKAAQPAPQANGLTNAFKATKAASVEAKKVALHKPSHSPSKLRQISNASEPMAPVPEKDSRINVSPSKARGQVFPGLMGENADGDVKMREGKRKLSIPELTTTS